MVKKKSLLIFALLTISFKGFSQEPEQLELKKWTLRSILVSQPYTFKTNRSLPLIFTGIGAKLNYEKLSYRFSFEHINYINEVESKFQKGSIIENTIRLGGEYKMSYYEVINLSVFVDGGITKLYEEATRNNLDSNINVSENYNAYSVGAIFGIGFDYFITPSFSLSLETRMDLLHIYGDFSREDYIDNYSVNYVTSNKKINLNILGGFSLNYHF